MKILGALLVALALAGCTSGGSAPTTVPPTTAASSPAERASIQQQVVAALKNSCTDLSSFTGNPDNWALTAQSGDSAPFEVAVVGGDGGNVVLLVTPGEPYATLELSSNYAVSTNALLYYSGCRGFTYDPDAGADYGNDGGTNVDPPPSAVTIDVPDFRGFTEADARAWKQDNGFDVTLNFSYGFSVYTFCQTDMIAVITQQSLAPGSMVSDNVASVIRFDAECPPQ
jgi:hypothetical protein